MTTGHLMMGVEPTPEIYLTVDNSQYNCDVINQPWA
jgi:hypothetical protein